MKDRRTCIRFDSRLNLVFRPIRDQSPYSFGILRNFSRKGFCFASEEYTPSDEKVMEFKVEEPGEGVFINGIGEVVWHQLSEDENRFGIKLRDMHKESRWEILEYCYNQWVLTGAGRSG